MPDQPIDVSVPPSGTDCVECDALGGWWLHLRRCAQCGHIGCCDNFIQHASKHARESDHPVMNSFEPGEAWFYDYRNDETISGPSWLRRRTIPESSPFPGPADTSQRTGSGI